MEKRKRINTSVDAVLYEKLQRYKDQYGFKNICEFNVAMLNVLVTHLETMELLNSTDDMDITKVFDDMADYGREQPNVELRIKKR